VARLALAVGAGARPPAPFAKLYVLGGGWSYTGPDVGAMAVAVLIEVPWDQCEVRHRFVLELVDDDGQQTVLPGDGTVRVDGEFETGRQPGQAAGTPVNIPLAFNFPPLPLAPGRRWQWRLSIDDETREEWQLGFSTRPRE